MARNPALKMGYKFPSWPKFPFRSGPRHLPTLTIGTMSSAAAALIPARLPIGSEGEATRGKSLRLTAGGVSVDWYFPTTEELETVRALFPDCEPKDPPWDHIQAKLIKLGHSTNWSDLAAPAIVALLQTGFPNLGLRSEQSDELDDEAKRRPCFKRDQLWLTWKQEEGLTPAKIRDRWNGMSGEQRRAIAFSCCNDVGDGKNGRDVVKKGLAAAGAENNL